jgi:hypothetical protein
LLVGKVKKLKTFSDGSWKLEVGRKTNNQQLKTNNRNRQAIPNPPTEIAPEGAI